MSACALIIVPLMNSLFVDNEHTVLELMTKQVQLDQDMKQLLERKKRLISDHVTELQQKSEENAERTIQLLESPRHSKNVELSLLFPAEAPKIFDF